MCVCARVCKLMYPTEITRQTYKFYCDVSVVCVCVCVCARALVLILSTAKGLLKLVIFLTTLPTSPRLFSLLLCRTCGRGLSLLPTQPPLFLIFLQNWWLQLRQSHILSHNHTEHSSHTHTHARAYTHTHAHLCINLILCYFSVLHYKFRVHSRLGRTTSPLTQSDPAPSSPHSHHHTNHIITTLTSHSLYLVSISL